MSADSRRVWASGQEHNPPSAGQPAQTARHGAGVTSNDRVSTPAASAAQARLELGQLVSREDGGHRLVGPLEEAVGDLGFGRAAVQGRQGVDEPLRAIGIAHDGAGIGGTEPV